MPATSSVLPARELLLEVEETAMIFQSCKNQAT
jgi:hypothetical protein